MKKGGNTIGTNKLSDCENNSAQDRSQMAEKLSGSCSNIL
jgi:hypothetical protein